MHRRVFLKGWLGRRFGFEWAYRPASKGRVIAGFPEKAITPGLPARSAEFGLQAGR